MDNKETQRKIFQYRNDKFETPDLQRQRVEIVFKTLRPYFKRRVLDIGAGHGEMVKILRGKGYAVEGMDINPNELVQEGNFTKLPDKEYDTVVCSHIIEHMTDEELALGFSEIKRVLIGKLIIATPYDEDLDRLICPLCRIHLYGHRRSFTRESMTLLLEGFGFRVVKIKVIPIIKFRLPYIPTWILMLPDNLIGLQKNLLVVAEKAK
ncbi:MAG: methyltransferase domain-containing protein [Candidatus Omnitrophica bacterium]|nr:methyltransferase domain-containing protein [Candidatus Omnitrophota bacterium]